MELEEIRQKIDTIDHEIIQKLNERVRLAIEIGKIKHAQGKDIYNPTREVEVLEKLTATNPGPLDNESIHSIFREIISAARASERFMKVAYLGPEATFTHQAALKNFGTKLEFKAMNHIMDVIMEVEHNDADYGVFPIENSTGGSVNNSQEILVETELKIIAEVYLKVEHCLISKSKPEEITDVYSKDQAISQCRDWIRRNLPRAHLHEVGSTTAGVQIAKKETGAAAIASLIAADMYGVPVIKENIQDRTDNFTRFLVIGKFPSPPLGNGRDKTSLVFSIHDEVGGLQKALESFSARTINLLKIESRPSRKRPWDYYFFVDLVGHIEDSHVAETVEDLKAFCPFVKWLGSYPNQMTEAV